MTSQQTLKYCYAAFALCVISSLIPIMVIQTFSMAFTILTIIAFYIVRRKWVDGSFERTEANYLIKTFWIWSLIYAVGIMVAGTLISTFGDMTAINTWTQSVVEAGVPPDEESMKQMTEEYMATNAPLIAQATILCALPALIYAIWRSKPAFSRIQNPVAPKPDAIIG